MSAAYYQRGGRDVRAADLHAEQVAADRRARGEAHRAAVEKLAPGDRVTVRAQHVGTIESRDGDRVTVRFDTPIDRWPQLPLERQTVPLSVVSRAGDS